MVVSEAHFTVNGGSKKELESRAIEIIGDLFGPDSGGVTFDLRITPLVELMGDSKPVVWEAEVTARCGR